MDDLRVLEVNGSELKRLWQCEFQAPLQLRELNIDASLLEFPKSIGQLMYLERIVAERTDLTTLPEEFCNLNSLKYLKLRFCHKLQMLPYSFGNLTNLRHMDLYSCESLEMLPDSLGNLTNLQHIDLSNCKSLKMLPDSLGNLRSLQYIRLSCCKMLKELPQSWGI
jgi:Leucine-rich repeat (LRR) protein